MAWFAAEEDNLRAMLTVLAAASPADAARAARLLFMYWKSRGAYGEIRQRFTTVLEHPDLTDRARAELFGLLSDAELMVGDLDASEAAARQSLSLAEPGAASALTRCWAWRWSQERAATPRRFRWVAKCWRSSTPSTTGDGC